MLLLFFYLPVPRGQVIVGALYMMPKSIEGKTAEQSGLQRWRSGGVLESYLIVSQNNLVLNEHVPSISYVG